MELGLSGRVALVTGGSRGLGYASARALALEGCRVVICGRRRSVLDEAIATLAAIGPEIHGVEADIADHDAAVHVVQAAVEHFGRLDVLVGNIGGPPSGDPFAQPLELYRTALEQGTMSQIALALAAVPAMRVNSWGRICFITATGIREPLPGHGLSALRAGLWGWAKSASHELVREGITVNMVCPGWFLTDRAVAESEAVQQLLAAMPQMRGMAGDPDDFGSVVAFLCSERGRWVNGMAINVDGGVTLASH
jgi:3-oxoacyl-[acyl-carrier protein] reductase